MTGIHGLEHIQGLAAATFADDQPVGTHSQAVHHQVTDVDGTLAFDVGGPGLQAHHVLLAQLQLGAVFNRDNTIRIGDEAAQHIQQCRLAGACAATDDNVQMGDNAGFNKFGELLGKAAKAYQVFDGQRFLAEFTDGDTRPIDS